MYGKPRQILELRPEGRGIREKPRKAYMDGIDEIASKMGPEGLNWGRLQATWEAGLDWSRQSQCCEAWGMEEEEEDQFNDTQHIFSHLV